MTENKLDFDLDFLESKSNKAKNNYFKDSTFKEAFYEISNTKLIMLSVFTLGFFEIYWFYRQWKFIEKVKNLKLTPWARGLFAPLFAYSLFKYIFELSKDAGEKQTPSAGWLAAGYFILASMGRFPGWAWLISIASFWPLIPVQNHINQLFNKKYSNGATSTTFNWKEVVVMIIGGIILLLALFGGSS